LLKKYGSATRARSETRAWDDGAIEAENWFRKRDGILEIIRMYRPPFTTESQHITDACRVGVK